jgi:hypothetical protein
VRATATPDALIQGATAVFRNPAMLAPRARGDVSLLDVRGPEVTGISGMAVAASYRLDARTAAGIGYQHVGVGGIHQTTDAPDEGNEISVGQDLLAFGASHVRSSLTIGAGAQYLHSSALLNQAGALRLSLGASYAAPPSIPVLLAVTAQNEDNTTLWAGAARVTPPLGLHDWALSATYGVTGGGLRPRPSHRLTADGSYREALTLQLGAVYEPEDDGHVMTAIGSIGVRVNRYEIGVVSQALANGFGAVHTFRIGMVF